MDDNIFNNSAFKGMDAQKLEFIRQFAQMPKPDNMKQAMPFLLAQMNRAKNNKIRFDKPEVALLVEMLSKDLSPEEQDQINKMMAIIGAQIE